MPDLPDRGRTLQDELGDVFGQECARHISRYVVYELRRDVDDEFVRLVLQAVLVADAVIHDCPAPEARLFRMDSISARAEDADRAPRSLAGRGINKKIAVPMAGALWRTSYAVCESPLAGAPALRYSKETERLVRSTWSVPASASVGL